MTEINMQKADPQDWDDLRRDFKPIQVGEKDMSRKVLGDDGLYRILQRRVRVVFFIGKDQTTKRHLAWDMGPATGEDAVLIPCEGAVEMSQVFDIFETHIRQRAPAAMADRALRQEARDQRFLRGLIQEADERRLNALGLSSFGQYARVQRTSN